MPGMLLVGPLTARLLPCPALRILLDKAESSQGATQCCEFLARPVTRRVCYKEKMEGTALFAMLWCKATTQSDVFTGFCFPSQKTKPTPYSDVL